MAISLETLALAAQMKGGGGGGSSGSPLPSVKGSDNGKVLTVKGGRWQAVQPAKELPGATAANNGKVLGIVNGAWSVMQLPVTEDELPAVTTADNGKILGIVNGKWAAMEAPKQEDELPAVTTADNGKVLGIVDGVWAAVEPSGTVVVAGEGTGSTVQGLIGNADTTKNNQATGNYAHAEGGFVIPAGQLPPTPEKYAITTASGEGSHAEGGGTTASGQKAHAEGSSTIASGFSAHAEGADTSASGMFSHAEGANTTAIGASAHAEGFETAARGPRSHAEGEGTQATASGSHTEGNHTQARGVYSHAEGNYTIANHASQHVFGEYNIADPASGSAEIRGTYVEIVGNGTGDNTKSNARTLDWDGNEVLAGKLTVGAAPTANMDVATKQYVDGKGLPAVTASDNGKVLGVSNGQWTVVTPASGGALPMAAGSGTNSVLVGNTSGTNANAASGTNAVAAGVATTATHKSQLVFGEFNEADPSQSLSSERGEYVEIVGNGYDEYSRANARTLDWYGNETLGGNITIQGGSLTLGNVTLTAEKLEALLMMVG